MYYAAWRGNLRNQPEINLRKTVGKIVARYNKARTAVADLLGRLEIAKVICVDDQYAQGWTVDSVLEAQTKLAPEQVVSLFPEIGTVPEDETVRREKIRRIWDQMNPTAQSGLAEKIMAGTPVSQVAKEPDSIAAESLRKLVGKDRLTELTPIQWDKREAQVIESAATSGTLILFDQDLTKTGGSATGGMVLLRNALTKDASGRLICGLLTHTATIDNQQEQWEIYAKDNGVDPHRFVLVAKEWLIDDPQGFVRMLKLVALAPNCNRMKAKAKVILESVNKEAAQGIEKLSVFEFDHIVFRLSHEEGTWEIDTLFRLHAIFQRPALRQRAYADAELTEIIHRLRGVSQIPADAEPGGALQRTGWDLQRSDLYEDGNHINSLHLPIEVGDIFRKTDGTGTKSFILLGQPCDLVVRANGERSPELSDALLVEIIPKPADVQERPPYIERMEYYGLDPQSEHFIKFRGTHFVEPCVLDLCAFNADGVSRIDVASTCPQGLLPSWANRFEGLKKWAIQMLRKYDELGRGKWKEEDLQRAADILPPVVGNSRLFKAKVEFHDGGRRVIFNCQRVGRLCRPKALALTAKYVSCLTRPAFDLDLGRRIQNK